MAASRFSPPATPLLVGERHLPDDVLQRVLVGLPLDDHSAAASVCKSFRGIITGPRFLAARRRYGFAERGVVTVSSGDGVLQIKMALKDDVMATFPADLLPSGGSTTDGGARLFVSTRRAPGEQTLPVKFWRWMTRASTRRANTSCQILAVDASSRRWRRFAALPRAYYSHCIEWHAGLLYVAGGASSGHDVLNTFHVFNEATGLWEDLPPMPHACMGAASGVIGNELFIVGGFNSQGDLRTLQIYDIATRTWRVGAPLPEIRGGGSGVVVDGKLLILGPISQYRTLVYHPQSNTWAEEAAPEGAGYSRLRTCAHEGRVFLLKDGAAYSRATDGSWSLCTRGLARPAKRIVLGSVLLG